MTEKVTKLALASRLIVLILQLLSNMLFPDHNADVFRAPSNRTYSDGGAHHLTFFDKFVQFCFGGLRHWDGEYFLHIAEHTYSYENTLAFYPLYPLLVRIIAKILQYIGLGLSFRSWSLLVGVAINLYCFCKATNCLYALTQRIFGDLNKSWNAALLFCFNPAAIFFSAVYSEALFCWLSMYLMLECITEMRFLQTSTALALSIVSRSNGLINAGFPIYFFLRKSLLRQSQLCYTAMKLLICLFCTVFPLTLFYFYAFQQFCLPDKYVEHAPEVKHYARQRDYIIAGNRQSNNSPWCDETFPSPYAYIQSHYWNVGFMRYYQLKQLPNFLLALPILSFIIYHCCKYLKRFVHMLWPKHSFKCLLHEYKSFPFVLHSLFLAFVCVFYVNIQVSTRLLCSSTPCLYWFAADHLPKTFDQIKLRSKAGLIVAWFGSYFVLGTALFSNNLPWT